MFWEKKNLSPLSLSLSLCTVGSFHIGELCHDVARLRQLRRLLLHRHHRSGASEGRYPLEMHGMSVNVTTVICIGSRRCSAQRPSIELLHRAMLHDSPPTQGGATMRSIDTQQPGTHDMR